MRSVIIKKHNDIRHLYDTVRAVANNYFHYRHIFDYEMVKEYPAQVLRVQDEKCDKNI